MKDAVSMLKSWMKCMGTELLLDWLQIMIDNLYILQVSEDGEVYTTEEVRKKILKKWSL